MSKQVTCTVYFEDQSWTTLLVDYNVTADELTQKVSQKRHLHLGANDWCSLWLVTQFRRGEQVTPEPEFDEDGEEIPPPPPPRKFQAGRCLHPNEKVLEVPELMVPWQKKRESIRQRALKQATFVEPPRLNPDPLNHQLTELNLTFLFKTNVMHRRTKRSKAKTMTMTTLNLGKTPEPLTASPTKQKKGSITQSLIRGSNCVNGYLEKKGNYNKAWRERWFVLMGGQLYYFKSPEHRKSTGSINIEAASARLHRTLACSRHAQYLPFHELAARYRLGSTISPTVEKILLKRLPLTPSGGDDRFVFDVVTPERVYELRSKSRADMQMWMSRIDQATELNDENDALDEMEDVISGIEYFSSEADEQVQEELMTLEGVLKHPAGLTYFLTWCVRNHCEENINFWLEAEQYRQGREDGNLHQIMDDAKLGLSPSISSHKHRDNTSMQALSLPSSSQLAQIRDNGQAITSSGRKLVSARKKAMSIYERFVAEGAVNEVMVDGNTRVQLKELIRRGDPARDVFDSLQSRVYDTLQFEVFPKFLDSQVFQKLQIVAPSLTAAIDVDNTLAEYSAEEYQSNFFLTDDMVHFVDPILREDNAVEEDGLTWTWQEMDGELLLPRPASLTVVAKEAIQEIKQKSDSPLHADNRVQVLGSTGRVLPRYSSSASQQLPSSSSSSDSSDSENEIDPLPNETARVLDDTSIPSHLDKPELSCSEMPAMQRRISSHKRNSSDTDVSWHMKVNSRSIQLKTIDASESDSDSSDDDSTMLPPPPPPYFPPPPPSRDPPAAVPDSDCSDVEDLPSSYKTSSLISPAHLTAKSFSSFGSADVLRRMASAPIKKPPPPPPPLPPPPPPPPPAREPTRKSKSILSDPFLSKSGVQVRWSEGVSLHDRSRHSSIRSHPRTPSRTSRSGSHFARIIIDANGVQWEIHEDPSTGVPYYFNKETQQSMWESPPGVDDYILEKSLTY